MADQCPNKSDIQVIFKRLRNLPANKVCFDCNAKNPTWATVTYGVFICIDCSAVHRSLGVHLTFVRSTQLDTNWTWLQLRQMQLGGNANANSFFRQHNCSTTDAQQKYNSRAAQLYREKLHQMAIQAMRVHGNKFDVVAAGPKPQLSATLVHLDSTHEQPVEEKKEVDFFEEIKSEASFIGFDEPLIDVPQVPTKIIQPSPVETQKNDGSFGQPNVNLAFTADPSSAAARKPTIGARKPAAKKGLGAKKGGLGAQRVKTNFDDIEREAQIADEQKVRADEDAKKNTQIKEEEEETQLASMRLAYKDLSIKQKREEEKMKISDPKKAVQMERLGMGFASRTGVSHSALTDMKTIEQEGVVEGHNRSSLAATSTRSTFDSDFFDDYQFAGGFSMYKGSQNDAKNMDWMLVENSKERSSNKGWTDQEPRRASSSTSSTSSESHGSSRPSRESAPAAAHGTEAQQKFGSAKAISSDQFFSDSSSNDWERKSNLSRFEGSSSISSADYFNDGRSSMGSRSNNQASVQSPDLEDVKESVRQGVTKVAGKLSNLANGVMSSIQERYGY